ncbi:chromosome replication initiator DnaA [Staphylococcus gallinarum]|uniref:Chromosome replication initiator DnaA n=1 Tax=Staphylococcus gallinarum TaxID=1293 RepID=A0A380F9W2_STAGA|nr:chromosome replication initiator DnaA [Staphylococcus gallinarum]
MHSLENDEAVIVIDDPFVANWLKSHYVEIIQTALYEAIGHEIMPVFYSEDELANMQSGSSEQNSNQSHQPKRHI